MKFYSVLIIFFLFYLSCSNDPTSSNDDKEIGTVIDIDANKYKTIKIGDQWWMAENLKVIHYRNGDAIPNVIDITEWINLTTGAWCSYNNDDSNVETYGRLYNWYTVDDSRNIAPTGWHVPTDEEWKQLELYLGMSESETNGTDHRGTDEGGKLKEIGTTHWDSPNIGATNEIGFSALPAGSRNVPNGMFYSMGSLNYFWTYDAWGRVLWHNDSKITDFHYGFKTLKAKGLYQARTLT